MDLAKQYNHSAEDFSRIAKGEDYLISNRHSREIFYSYLDFIKPRLKLLDLACGDGQDILHYKQLGAKVYSIDSSEEMVKIARNKLINTDIRVASFEQLPFANNFFNIVLSKYAIMTATDMGPAFNEINRVLKPGGIVMYLVTHPFRKYFERKDPQGNYFDQTIVTSRAFQNQVAFREPTHTMSEYLNDFLFKNFDIDLYDERWEPAAAEQIDNRKYPCFLLISERKKDK
jgi:ubiquinone/menaquinone biosynthesis C-methylase UbiE